MKLSVLIPSVPARRAMALALYDSIAAQAEGLPAEILLLLDNKQRSIGKKREALVRLAQAGVTSESDSIRSATNVPATSPSRWTKRSAKRSA